MENSIEQVRLRRFGNNLVMSGRAVILFGVWAAVHVIYQMIRDREEIMELFNLPEEFRGIGFAIVMFIMVLMIVLIMFLYIYIGHSAVNEGKGKKRTSLYLVLAVLVTALTIRNYLTDGGSQMFGSPDLEGLMRDDFMTELVLDITMVFACVDMIISAVIVRLTEKRIKEMQSDAA